MRVSTSQFLAVASAFWGTAYAACTSNLVIDDYATYSTNINKQGSWTSGMLLIRLRLNFL